MKKIITSIFVIALVAGVSYAGTSAFFSDVETSTGNILTAGAIDLKIDSTAHYAGMICTDVSETETPDYQWLEDTDDLTVTSRPDMLGDPCVGSWELQDLSDGDTFFNIEDVKPGDWGENTIRMHVIDNDAYMCAVVDNLVDNDNGLTEPESKVDTTAGDGEGELSQEVRFFAWADDGNNVWEDQEQILFSNTEGPASDVVGGVVYPLFTPDNGPLAALDTEYLGLYWCYGNINVDETNHILSCDGQGGTNLTQTDSMSANISFYAEQSRNNPDFTCSDELLQRS